MSPQKATQFLESLLNARIPHAGDPAGFAMIRRLRSQTESYWPDLWGWVADEQGRGEDRALHILQKIQWYLQQFWTTQDPHARDWYIHRIREYYHHHQIQPKTEWRRNELAAATSADDARAAASWLNIDLERELDTPPARTPFEESLFYLQRIGDRVRYCQNPTCDPGRNPACKRYFIRIKKGQKYCCRWCSVEMDRKTKRDWARARAHRKKAK